ncbi:PiggyBac transposable element-derived protein 3 [Phytophthora citrophthora]|uniref:PiggyBac transposable element-derived protein 3 n=1 Tax=Phytophthora citrophthora TaxID=4793 RepID=A0AAD9LNX7_9STRA|nr:PiggyBac transposable element-derived protein 3 [Phytophthora citrophthora]
MDQAFLALRVGDTSLSKKALVERENTLRTINSAPVSAEFETDAPSYPGLGGQEAKPVDELLDVWRSPLLTLLYFVPNTLWVSITNETNRYCLQQVDKRAEKMAARQRGRHCETVAQIVRRLRATQAYGAHEILHVAGLLVARMMCPQRRRFAAHWTLVEDGAIPAGLFGRYMTRDRCQNILRDLHFVDNTVEHGRDKLWKLRPVADKIQERFLSGWTLPAVFSFDEGVLSATSRLSPTRMFMSDKPHRFGSKLFML